MDQNSIVLNVCELLEVIQRMSDEGMKYVLFDIQKEGTRKKCYLEAVTESKSSFAVDYGALDSVEELED